ncbi:MAG: Ig-like domain-containing protein, partial [Eggerthellaceae bacterium]|nr:Ig-like domain-containing protein [Eggerthellaceae bacterium]
MSHEHCVQAAGKILRIVLSIVLFVSLTPIAMQPRVALAAETASPIVAAQTASAKPVITVKRAATGKVTMPVKGTYKLAASATVGKLTYKSSKPKVASVTKGGVLKAKKAGKTTVTVVAENGKSKASTKVSLTVMKKTKYKKVESLSLKLGSTSL